MGRSRPMMGWKMFLQGLARPLYYALHLLSAPVFDLRLQVEKLLQSLLINTKPVGEMPGSSCCPIVLPRKWIHALSLP